MAQFVSTMRATPLFKYRASNVTANDGVLTDILTATRPGNLIPTRGKDGMRFKGIEVFPFGTDAANEAFTCQLQHIKEATRWGVDPAVDPSSDFGFAHAAVTVKQYMVRNITTLTCTLGATADGTANAALVATDFTADTITQARTTFGTALEAAFMQTSVLYSPTSDVVGASYYLPNFGNADWMRLAFDSIESDSAATANALIALYV